jgi:arylsulfatase A-like enzyme
LSRTGRWLRAAGEGALAGWAAGFALGYWQVLLNEDLSRRMFHLAGERFFPPLLAGTILGALLSLGVELLFAASERTKRGPLLCMAILAILYAAGVALAAFPLRPRLFPLRIFSGKLVSLCFFAMIAGPPGALLAARFRESFGRARRATAGAGPARPGLAATLGLSLAVLSAAAALGAPRLSASRPGNGLSVILLSLDTLRADRLGALGCPRPLTPRLDALARQGTVFEHAESAAPWTLPSHASIFSSLLPYDHGTRWEHKPLRPSIATLAEHFREAGFRTASFNGGGYISAYLGLSQGFEIYEEHDEGKEGGPERIAAAALAWIRSRRAHPFFLFLHTYEVHSPYTHSELADPHDAGGLARTFEVADVVAVQRGERFLTPGERRYVAALYDGDVAHADRVMGGLLETLREEGILDRVLLVVLSDHGEDLWDHDMRRSPGHGHSLYEELLHVPLFFRAPGKVAAGARIGAPVSLLDVAPTVLALAGLPPDPQHRGRSLESALRGGAEPALAPIAAESTEYGPERFSLRQGSLKVILAPRPEQANAGIAIPGVRPLEIFDLEADPAEKTDLSSTAHAGAAAAVESVWKRAEKVAKPGGDEKGGRRRLPAELEEQLRSLGYVQ